MRNKEISLKKILRFVILCLAIAMLCYSAVNLCNYWWESKESDAVTEDMIDMAVTTPPKIFLTVPTEPADGEVGSAEPETSEYPPISVDFEKLQGEYKDVIAWIHCEDTVISYPVVQSENNSYYLRRLPTGKKNSKGSIFMDYRNDGQFLDFNTILYGHKMKNGSMFGTLQKYKKQEYYDEHPVFYILTPERNYKVELIAGYVAKHNDEVYALSEDPVDQEAFLQKALEKSTFKTKTMCSVNDRYVTFSTCSYDFNNARFLLIGKLIEIGSAPALE